MAITRHFAGSIYRTPGFYGDPRLVWYIKRASILMLLHKLSIKTAHRYYPY